MPDMKMRARYRELAAEYRPNAGHLLACLHKFQHEFGYIPTDAVPVIANHLGMTPAGVFGALSFYTEFRTTPPPATLVNWCSGPACRLKGGDEIRRAMEAVLQVGIEENSADNRYGMHIAQCDGSCEHAPLVWLRRRGEHPHRPDGVLVSERGVVYGDLTVAQAVEMARRLKEGGE